MHPDDSSVNTSTLIVPGASSLTTSPLVVKNAKSACTSVSSMFARLRLWWNTDLPRAHRVQRGSKGTWPCIQCFCSASSDARVSLWTPKPSSSAPQTCDMHLPLLFQPTTAYPNQAEALSTDNPQSMQCQSQPRHSVYQQLGTNSCPEQTSNLLHTE